MGEIRVSLAKEVYVPGEEVSGTAYVSLDKPVSQRSATALLIGKERTQVNYTVTVHTGGHAGFHTGGHTSFGSHTGGTRQETRTAVEESEFLHLGSELPLPVDEDGKFRPGTYNIPFKFILPQWLPGTYAGQHAKITYYVEAKIDVPLGFDIRESSELIVVPGRRAPASGPIDACSDSWNIPSSAGLNLMLERSVYGRGEAVNGRCAFRNPDSKNLRKIVVKLEWIEQARAQGHIATANVGEQVAEIPIDGRVPKGEYPFTIRLAQNAPQTYESQLSSLRCVLGAKLDIAWAGDVAAKDSIIIGGTAGDAKALGPYYPDIEAGPAKGIQEKAYQPRYVEPSAERKFCSHCGTAIRSPDASYCPDCGSRLQAQAAGAPPPTAQIQAKVKRRLPSAAVGVENCIVCRDALRQDDDVVWCPHCGKLAHREHMIEWVRGKKSCPACGKTLEEDYYV